jgi:hypothetical protein
MKYRKKPVVVEALRFLGTSNYEEISNFVGKTLVSTTYLGDKITDITIKTLEGYLNCYVGYWVVKGVDGEFYSVRSDVFNQTYDECEEEIIVE